MPPYDFKNFSADLAAAGVTVEEAAKLFKVSRVTIYSWRDGHGPNQQVILDRALRIIDGLKKATAARALPVLDLEKADRYQKIVETLRVFLGT